MHSTSFIELKQDVLLKSGDFIKSSMDDRGIHPSDRKIAIVMDDCDQSSMAS